MGSFFVGGRTVEAVGAPIEERVLAANGIPLRIKAFFFEKKQKTFDYLARSILQNTSK